MTAMLLVVLLSIDGTEYFHGYEPGEILQGRPITATDQKASKNRLKHLEFVVLETA